MSGEVMAKLYFRRPSPNISRSLWKYRFGYPNFELLNPYLFLFIRANPNISDYQIRHIAYRIWEYLVKADRAGPIQYPSDEANDMVLYGEIQGWWLETDGNKPRGYQAWCNGDQGDHSPLYNVS